MQDINEMKEREGIFKRIELTAERFKQQFQKLAIKAQSAINSQINTSKFEASYAISIGGKQRIKTMNEVKEVRNELWQEALKMTNGNINAASDIYEKLCAFP